MFWAFVFVPPVSRVQFLECVSADGPNQRIWVFGTFVIKTFRQSSTVRLDGFQPQCRS
jgi:hypothetical protein